MHPFFADIQNYPHLAVYCDLSITNLPAAYRGKGPIKAILLGADPTNNGTKDNKGLKELKTVFGLGEYTEFFSPQKSNLSHIGLDKENLYIQNVCRNYFKEETSKNKYWGEIAQVWLPYLKEELDKFDAAKKLPVLSTSEVIMKVLVEEKVANPSAIYANNLSYVSEVLGRQVYALYRHPRYSLSSDTNRLYKEFLNEVLNIT